MTLKETIIARLNRLPYVKGLYRENANFKRNSCFPAGHFYSPIISIEEVKARESDIWGKTQNDGIDGIDLQTQNQIQFARDLSIYYNEMPFEASKKDGLRYYFANSFYSYTDGIVLYSIMRHFKPKRIIEIGSGFSSALMLDTNQVFFENQINLTFIEPYPERLYSLITEADKQSTTIIESSVQSVPLSVFQKLEAGDILFIDSTHVSKTGSDVNHILFEILPSLQSGVMIHFHDIFYPFEYPKEWVYGGKNWNEDYFLKAFLMYNQKFEIKLFSEYLHKLHPHAFSQMPLTAKNPGGNFWMQKK
jgi:predicted O-methyltransferase YrrM